MAKNLLIVESPAKARTIKKYLGKDFDVMASNGHVRDLRPKEGAVEPDNAFTMHYEVIERSEKRVAEIAKAMKKADALYLATDPDREGEAISWHLSEILNERNVLEGKPVRRVVFHEITKRAVLEAVENTREVAMDLVNAQQARRALDYLVGFNLSPLLWKKIRRGLSAGRVQSPALRLIVEREEEIDRFISREYWTIEADLNAYETDFVARLSLFGGEKLEQFSITDEGSAQSARKILDKGGKAGLPVTSVEEKQRRRNPTAPFTTSTMQQEAVRKLGFTAARAMRVAQQLYEGIATEDGPMGLITYMRTDSVNLAAEAVTELRTYIDERYGTGQTPAEPPVYKTKAKNAQEAHEAVRPTSVLRTPDSLKDTLEKDQLRLYELIWKRTVASQMKHATINTVAVQMACGDDNSFRATGSVLVDPGFLAVYEEGVDDSKCDNDERRLPPLKKGDTVVLKLVRPEQHFTEPPPRYSEATIVRALEDYGIGRPSTYAAIISTLQNREYAEMRRGRFHPTDVGRIVNKFLTEHFSQYVDYDFTARLEDDLDAISRGEKEWVPLMENFWQPFTEQVQSKETSVSRKDVDAIRDLGIDPKSERMVSARMGKFGPCVQIGVREDEEKPKFARLQAEQSIHTITFDEAMVLFQLPRALGESADGEPVSAAIGRFGPYVRYGDKYASIGKEDNPYTIELPRALEIIDEKKKADASKEITVFEGTDICILNGRYGPYATDGKKNARIPKDREPESITLEEALQLIEQAPAARKGKRARK
jgi:DNA topoisomerase-1